MWLRPTRCCWGEGELTAPIRSPARPTKSLRQIRASIPGLEGWKRMSHGGAWCLAFPCGICGEPGAFESHVPRGRFVADLGESRTIADVAYELGIGDETFTSRNH